MPRLNWFLFGLYAVLSVAVLAGALASPVFRTYAYAPVRELILPPPAPIVVSVLYTTEKEAWLKEAAAQFESGRPTLDGRPIELKFQSLGSRELYLAILNGQAQPDLISPASSLQISILQDLSTSKFGAPVVNPADTAACRPVLRTPLVLVAWRERASVLWGDNPGAGLWPQLHDALVNPQGWGAFGHPEWGYVKFGHTSPLTSNSGFMTLLLLTYSYHGKTSGLTSADVLSNAGYQKWLGEFEGAISEFGESTGTYMRDMIAYGPSRYDVIAVYEATAIEQIDNAIGRYGELHVYYPPETVVSDHPFCVLQANWVTPEKARAARMFLDYLTSRPAQALGLKAGFRPVDPGLTLDGSDSPFQVFAANGFKTDLPPAVSVPDGNTLNTLLDFWARSIAR